MGLFDGLKAMVDIVKTGIDAVKATDKMDAVVEKVMDSCEDALSPEQNALYNT